MRLMTQEEFDNLCEQLDEVRKLDGFDLCCMGTLDQFGRKSILVYSVAAVIEQLISEGIASRDDAWEYFHFNITGAYLGEGMPGFLDGEEHDELTWNAFLERIKK